MFVQSFETGNLRRLRAVLRVPLVQLVSAHGAPADLVAAGDPRRYADLVTPAGLAAIAGYADAIGPEKDQVIARDRGRGAGRTHPAGRRRARGRACGCTPTPSATRTTSCRRTCAAGSADGDYGDSFAEYAAFFAAGVDGVFTDNTDTAFAARMGLAG